MRPDVNITKEAGLGRRNPTLDMVSGIIFGSIAATGLALNTTSSELKSIVDVEALGITNDFDEANKILVWHHCDRFFKRNPSGSLFIRLVAQATTLTQSLDNALTHAKQLLVDAQGKVRWLGVVRNPISAYVPVLSGGLDGDVLTAIDKAQELYNAEFAAHRPLYGILVEGRQFNGTVAAATDLRTKTDPNVGVVIAADLAISSKVVAATTPYQYYAAIGDVLGLRSLAKVHENIGWVEKFPLTDDIRGLFETAGLSSGLNIITYSADLSNLHDKGFIIPVFHTGLSGYFLNSDPTCVALSNDEAYMENGATLAKAARVLRAAYLPKLNSPIPLTSTGTIEPVKIAALERLGKDALDVMKRDGEISDLDVVIDPEQNFIENDENLEVQFSIVVIGTARRITGKLKLVSTL